MILKVTGKDIEEACAGHEWHPLFTKPHDPEHFREYMVCGYADLKQCSNCGAVGMADGHSARKVYLLSESWAQHKKQKAALWNARMAKAQNQACNATLNGNMD